MSAQLRIKLQEMYRWSSDMLKMVKICVTGDEGKRNAFVPM
jgi:hypothetical protein